MAEDQKIEPVPALFEQCLEVYEAMADQASLQPFDEEGDEMLVYEGFLTRLITQELHYSNPYYTKVTKRLKAMDCIRQLKRGGSTTPSRWLLLKPPTVEFFREVGTQMATRPSGWRESIEQQIRDINSRLQRAGL
jgi:hypothetical protein